MTVSDLFWQVSLADLKRGYVYRPATDDFACLVCGKSFVNGQIYPAGDQLYEAKKFAQRHLAAEHRSVFHVLLNLDRKLTGLTDHQKTLLELFYEGLSDNEVAKALGIGATSTIRNHRFSLREKQKQARVFLAIMELLAEEAPKAEAFIDIPRNARQVDDRFMVTEQEAQKILTAHFPQGSTGPLTSYPLKEKKRMIILRHLLQFFDPDRKYRENEVNEILQRVYSDYAILRRHLIDYGFMERTRDGSSYWIKL